MYSHTSTPHARAPLARPISSRSAGIRDCSFIFTSSCNCVMYCSCYDSNRGGAPTAASVSSVRATEHEAL